MKTALAEAKAAGAETLAPEEYARAEACLDGLTHEATEFRPFADPKASKYVGMCRPIVQALQGKMSSAREARVAPPVAALPAPEAALPPSEEAPPPPAPEAYEGRYPTMGTLAEVTAALPTPEPPSAPTPSEEVAAPTPAPDEGRYPAMGTLAEAMAALPTPEAALPPSEEAPPPPAPEAALAPVRVAPPPATAGKEPEQVKAKVLLEDIFFDFDKAEIRPDALKSLDGNVQWLRDNSKTNLVIEGHCDERGTPEYNLALGQRRAKAALDYLVAAGIDDKRIKIISYGRERPFVVGHDESAWKWNRRAHFVLP